MTYRSRLPADAEFLRRGALIVGLGAFHAWYWSQLLLADGYYAQSDLYEYFLPTFLAPRTVWSAYEFAGFPAFADPQNSAWYPLHLLFARGLGWWHGFIVSAYLVASAGAYLYVHRITGSRLAAMVAGVAWPLCEALAEKAAHLAMLHAYAWLPWILFCVEKLAERRTVGWLVTSSVSLAMLVLAGHPQAALYGIYLVGAYGVGLVVAEQRSIRSAAMLAVSFALAAGLTAAQTIPLLEVSREAARDVVTFGQFANSFAKTPRELLTIGFPQILHEGREAPTYTGVLTLLGAVLVVLSVRRAWRVYFWIGVAVVCLLLGLGPATPLAELAYHLPLYDKFRVVARHLAFYSLAIMVLGAMGVAALLRGKIAGRTLALCSLGAVVASGVGFSYIHGHPELFDVERSGGLRPLVGWFGSDLRVQGALWLATVASILFAGLTRRRLAAGAVLILVLVVDLLNSQPEPVTRAGFSASTLPAPLVQPSVHTRWLKSMTAGEHQRVLPLAGSSADPFVMGVFARKWTTASAGGYGPLLLDRLARLAGMGTNGGIGPGLLRNEDQSLNILGVKYVILEESELTATETVERHGITWTESPLDLAVGRADCGEWSPATQTLALPPRVRVKRVAVVAHLRCAEDVEQGARVATVRLLDATGEQRSLTLTAGTEISEAYHQRPEVNVRIRHELARVFEVQGEGEDFRANYLAELDVDDPIVGQRMELSVSSPRGWFVLDRLTIVGDDDVEHPISLLPAAIGLDDRWREVRRVRTSRVSDRLVDETVDGEQPYVIVENLAARPRAWLVPEVITLDDQDGLSAIRTSQRPDGSRFDPAATAFVPPEVGRRTDEVSGQPGRHRCSVRHRRPHRHECRHCGRRIRGRQRDVVPGLDRDHRRRTGAGVPRRLRAARGGRAAWPTRRGAGVRACEPGARHWRVGCDCTGLGRTGRMALPTRPEATRGGRWVKPASGSRAAAPSAARRASPGFTVTAAISTGAERARSPGCRKASSRPMA